MKSLAQRYITQCCVFYNVAFCIICFIQNGDNTVMITNAITKSKIVNTKNPNNVFRRREYCENKMEEKL